MKPKYRKKNCGCPWQLDERMLVFFSLYINLPSQRIVYFHILVGLHSSNVLFLFLLSFEDENHIQGLVWPAGFWYNSLARMNTMEHKPRNKLWSRSPSSGRQKSKLAWLVTKNIKLHQGSYIRVNVHFILMSSISYFNLRKKGEILQSLLSA